MIIALVGPHGVGKSTLGPRLAALLGIPFHPELGRELSEDRSWRPLGGCAEDPAERFDEELFRRELARDRASEGLSRVVETWHPGNLAFAARRSPGVVERWLPVLRASLQAEPALVVPLSAPAALLAARQQEPGSAAFFQEVGEDAARRAAALGLRGLSPQDVADQDPDTLARVLALRVHAHRLIHP